MFHFFHSNQYFLIIYDLTFPNAINNTKIIMNIPMPIDIQNSSILKVNRHH